jgi:hypothetical protein
MEDSYQEKLSHLNDLISLSRADGDESYLEIDFINSVAARLGIEQSVVDDIKEGKIRISFSPPTNESKIIEQFHRLIILIGIDKLIYKEEVSFCVELGLKMGLNYNVIVEVLTKTLHNPAYFIHLDEIQAIVKKYSE